MAIDCGLGGRLEIPELVRNNVGLVKRGGIHEEAKVNNLAEAGALGALLYVDYQNALYSARVSKAVSPIPVAIIRANDATSLLTLDLAARPMVSLAIDASPIRAECANVIIDFAKGESRHTVVCAHYDSRPSTPGANDNAAGVACVLAVVEKFIANKMPTPVRFVFFDGEELGLIGSKTYASSGWSNGCDKVINVDAVGGGRLAVLTRDRDNPLDSSLVESALQVAHKLQIRLKTAESRTGTSDHAPLMARGVRAVWLSDHPNIGRETDIDVVESIDLSELPATTELVWALLNE
jgi:aminopeptidase YwaD